MNGRSQQLASSLWILLVLGMLSPVHCMESPRREHSVPSYDGTLEATVVALLATVGALVAIVPEGACSCYAAGGAVAARWALYYACLDCFFLLRAWFHLWF